MNGFAIGGYDYGFGGGFGDYGAGYGFGFGGGMPVSSNTAAYGWPGFQGVAGFVNAGGSATQFAGWGGGARRVGGGLWNYDFGWGEIMAGLSATIDTIANGIYSFFGAGTGYAIGDRHQLWPGEYVLPWAIGNEMDIEAEGAAEEDEEVGKTENEARPAEAAKAPEVKAGKKTPVEIARAALPADRQGEAEALIDAMTRRKLPLKEPLIKRVARRFQGKVTVETAAYAVHKAWRAELAAAKERGVAAKPTEPAVAPAGDAKAAAPAMVEVNEPKPVKANLGPKYYKSAAACVGAGATDCIPMPNGEYEGLHETTR